MLNIPLNRLNVLYKPIHRCLVLQPFSVSNLILIIPSFSFNTKIIFVSQSTNNFVDYLTSSFMNHINTRKLL